MPQEKKYIYIFKAHALKRLQVLAFQTLKEVMAQGTS